MKNCIYILFLQPQPSVAQRKKFNEWLHLNDKDKKKKLEQAWQNSSTNNYNKQQLCDMKCIADSSKDRLRYHALQDVLVNNGQRGYYVLQEYCYHIEDDKENILLAIYQELGKDSSLRGSYLNVITLLIRRMYASHADRKVLSIMFVERIIKMSIQSDELVTLYIAQYTVMTGLDTPAIYAKIVDAVYDILIQGLQMQISKPLPLPISPADSN